MTQPGPSGTGGGRSSPRHRRNRPPPWRRARRHLDPSADRQRRRAGISTARHLRPARPLRPPHSSLPPRRSAAAGAAGCAFAGRSVTALASAIIGDTLCTRCPWRAASMYSQSIDVMCSSLRAVTSASVSFRSSAGRVSFGSAESTALSNSSHSSRPSTLLTRFLPVVTMPSNCVVSVA